MKRFTSARDLPDTVERDVDGLQEQTIAEDERRRQEELDLNNIAPKRPNWDLKRDLEKRLKKLERRDKEAVIILIRKFSPSQLRIAARTQTDGIFAWVRTTGQRIQAQQKAAGLDANSADRNEANLTGLSAEIAATATADLGREDSDLSNDDSESDTE